jgi:hypothetical protein
MKATQEKILSGMSATKWTLLKTQMSTSQGMTIFSQGKTLKPATQILLESRRETTQTILLVKKTAVPQLITQTGMGHNPPITAPQITGTMKAAIMEIL